MNYERKDSVHVKNVHTYKVYGMNIKIKLSTTQLIRETLEINSAVQV
jgi:hypothetical protein